MAKRGDAVALCTGAGSGIGRATAIALAERGAAVVVSDVDAAAGEEALARLRAAGAECASVGFRPRVGAGLAGVVRQAAF